MFKKLKEFFFGPSSAKETIEAPYKVETPTPLVLSIAPSAIAPVAVVTSVKTRKPRVLKTVVIAPVVPTKKLPKEKAATPVKKPAAMVVVSKKKKKS